MRWRYWLILVASAVLLGASLAVAQLALTDCAPPFPVRPEDFRP